MKPICVQCQRFYRPQTNGVFFTEGMPTVPRAIPGTSHPNNWKPYKIWQGDQWKCPECHHEIIVGVGMNPLSIHHMPDFKEMLEKTDATYQVNDC